VHLIWKNCSKKHSLVAYCAEAFCPYTAGPTQLIVASRNRVLAHSQIDGSGHYGRKHKSLPSRRCTIWAMFQCYGIAWSPTTSSTMARHHNSNNHEETASSLL